jgi:tryptophan halogenase
LTSLYVKQLFPQSNIIQIESSDVGILGAGEGSVPILPSFLRALKIDESDFIKKTKATFKLGINFENWSGDGKSYFHPFSPTITTLQYNNVTKEMPISGGLPNDVFSPFLINAIANEKSLDSVIPSSKLALENKSPYFYQDGLKKQSVGYSYHFDARLTADYLRNIGVNRGINLIDGVVSKFEKSGEDVSNIILENGLKIPCDFIFDCSGFARLIIGKEYETKWISYDKHLTVNSAVPFFLPQSSDHIKPYTRAIAMKYGWMWQIPLQHRWGCGYIFDDRYINSDEAKKEVEEYLGHPIESNRTFKFNAGRYENVWVNNCVAIGLSGGFIEPLEATSIMVSILGLSSLDPITLKNRESSMVKEYNEYMGAINDEIVSFLYYHYITKRDDSKFWKNYQNNTQLPEKLCGLLSKWVNRAIAERDQYAFSPSKVFSLDNWVAVGVGNGIIKKDLYKKYNEELMLDKRLALFIANFNTNLENISNKSTDHLNYLNSI